MYDGSRCRVQLLEKGIRVFEDSPRSDWQHAPPGSKPKHVQHHFPLGLYERRVSSRAPKSEKPLNWWTTFWIFLAHAFLDELALSIEIRWTHVSIKKKEVEHVLKSRKAKNPSYKCHYDSWNNASMHWLGSVKASKELHLHSITFWSGICWLIFAMQTAHVFAILLRAPQLQGECIQVWCTGKHSQPL